MFTITTLLEILSFFSARLTLNEILAKVARKMAQLMGVAGCIIFQVERDSQTITVLADYVSLNPSAQFRLAGITHSLDRYPALARILREQTPQVIYAGNLTAEMGTNLLAGQSWREMLLTPILYQEQTTGLLGLYVDELRQRQFTAADISVCQILSYQIALAMENARLDYQVAEGQLSVEAMQVIGQALASDLNYQRVVRNVADFAYRLVNAQLIYVVVPDNDEFRMVAMAGHKKRDTSLLLSAHTSLSRLEHHPLNWVARQKKPVIVADIQNEALPDSWRAEAQYQGWRAMIAAPLLAFNQLVGVLVAYAPAPNFFKANDAATLMSLASQAAVAIRNAQLFTELEAQHEALHQVSLRLVNAQEEERRRISRELHDELGQALTALKINLDVARRALPPHAPPKLTQSVHEASILAMRTLESARNLSLELHPAILDDLGLVSALRWEVDRYEQRTGQVVYFKADLADVVLRAELEITIYRIITEALTNVARHAQAAHISVQLQVENGQAVIMVEDDGVGFDALGWFNSPAERQSLGLIGMRERAGLLGGQFEVISKPGCGTKIHAQLPIGGQ